MYYGKIDDDLVKFKSCCSKLNNSNVILNRIWWDDWLANKLNAKQERKTQREKKIENILEIIYPAQLAME